MSKILQASYKTAQGKNFSLKLPDLKESLNKEDLKAFCQMILDKQIFTPRLEPLLTLEKIELVSTTKETVTL